MTRTDGDPRRGAAGVSDSRLSLLSPKVKPFHLARRAIVYVRQSTPQQVAEHKESAARQYALADRARALGWSPGQVDVIDDDQGRSGQTAEGRLGFQRLLAEVGLDRVGLVLGLEMSRLARSCKDWHQLLELCAIFRTLLADQDGLYDPTDHNDRLLLGLTGIMSERNCTSSSGACTTASAIRRDAARSSPCRRSATSSYRPASSRSTPTSRSRPSCGYCSTSSSARGPSTGCCATSCITASASPSARTSGRSVANWSGAGRTRRRCRTCCTTRPTPARTGGATGRPTRAARSRAGPGRAATRPTSATA